MNRTDIAVFLDRDGTVNEEVEYLSSPDKLQLIPRSVPAIRALNDLGVRVFIITNQSGVARGLFPETAVIAVHDALRAMLKKEGAVIDDFFYCPHLPGAAVRPYNRNCDCRKPKPGMLYQAQKKYAVDLKRSFVIGDRCLDIAAGNAVGATGVMVATGYGSSEIDDCRSLPDFFAPDLYEGVQFVKKRILARESTLTYNRTV